MIVAYSRKIGDYGMGSTLGMGWRVKLEVYCSSMAIISYSTIEYYNIRAFYNN